MDGKTFFFAAGFNICTTNVSGVKQGKNRKYTYNKEMIRYFIAVYRTVSQWGTEKSEKKIKMKSQGQQCAFCGPNGTLSNRS